LIEEIILTAVPRTVTGKKVKQIRREGWIPLVVYGPGFDSESYQANSREFNQVLDDAGLTSLVTLQVKGQEEPYKVLVRDIQRDVLTDELLHVDLYRVSMTQKITTEIPIEFVGIAPGAQTLEIMVLTIMDTLEIECLPGDLVSSLELDISPLETLDDVLTVADLDVPEGITVQAEPHEVVARLTYAARELEEEEEEEELPVEIAADEVEVIAKGKEQEEEFEEEE
jgi:large subunit ribosomal protein L25